jgi:hypothetical protein
VKWPESAQIEMLSGARMPGGAFLEVSQARFSGSFELFSWSFVILPIDNDSSDVSVTILENELHHVWQLLLDLEIKHLNDELDKRPLLRRERACDCWRAHQIHN